MNNWAKAFWALVFMSLISLGLGAMSATHAALQLDLYGELNEDSDLN